MTDQIRFSVGVVQKYDIPIQGGRTFKRMDKNGDSTARRQKQQGFVSSGQGQKAPLGCPSSTRVLMRNW